MNAVIACIPWLFWDSFRQLPDEPFLQTAEAGALFGMALELAGRIDPALLTPDAFYTLASARIAPMLTVVAALAEISGDASLLPPVEASVKAVIVAGQLLDDIGDWQEDLEAGRITFYLTRLIPPEAWPTGKTPSREQLQQALDADWKDVEGLRMVIDWFEGGLSAVQGLECSAWIEYVEEYHALTQQLLTASVTRHLAQSLRPLAQVLAN
jgi:hypothetical protein